MFFFPKCWLLHLFLERILPLLFLSPWSVSVLRLIRPTFVMMKKGCWLEKKSQAGLRLIFFGKVYWGQLAAGKIFVLGNSSKVNSSIRPLNLFFLYFWRRAMWVPCWGLPCAHQHSSLSCPLGSPARAAIIFWSNINVWSSACSLIQSQLILSVNYLQILRCRGNSRRTTVTRFGMRN